MYAITHGALTVTCAAIGQTVAGPVGLLIGTVVGLASHIIADRILTDYADEPWEVGLNVILLAGLVWTIAADVGLLAALAAGSVIPDYEHILRPQGWLKDEPIHRWIWSLRLPEIRASKAATVAIQLGLTMLAIGVIAR